MISLRGLTIINFVIVFYFTLLWILNQFNLENNFVRFFGELLTLPFLIAQVIFLLIGLRTILQGRKKIIFLVSFLALLLCSVLTIGSFF